MLGNREKNEWHFYFRSIPSLAVPREFRNETYVPYTYTQLSAIARKDVLPYYYKNASCEVNDAFFDQFDIKELMKQHAKFLNEH